MLEYEELRIRVRDVGPGRYLVLANGPASAADVVLVDRDPADYRDALNRLIEVELGQAPMGREGVAARLRDLGRQVFDLLLSGPIAACVEESQRRAQDHEPPRGLRLRFDLPPELRDLPVEALIAPSVDPRQSLALNYNLSLVRSLPGDPPGTRLPGALATPDRIHLLVAVATPADGGLPPLDASAELAALRRELSELAIQSTVLTGATRRAIEGWLGEHTHQPTAVLLIAHGAYDTGSGEGVVYLETEDGRCDAVPAPLLSGMLVQAQQLRLVVLNLCASGRNNRFEPFSGLAQALIGRGVPAVVAMQDQVTDAAAAVFGPTLLQRVSENQTIDQAMTAARQNVANLPGHTAIEWTTPVLFLHESYRHGWLFKAREMRDDGEQVADPLRDGATAMGRFEGPGNVSPATVLAAARYVRERGDWDRLLRMTPKRPSAQQKWLAAEARLELVWPTIRRACELLAADADPATTAALLAGIAEAVPASVTRCLAPEVERAQDVASRYLTGTEAAERGDWPVALGHFGHVLAARPGGYRDAVARHADVAGEVEVAQHHDAAELARSAERWADAAEHYAQVRRARPDGYRQAVVLADYAAGRAAEDEGRWADAAAAYRRCADIPGAGDAVPDVRARSARVTGLALAEDGDWAGALAALRTAAELGLGDDAWLDYTAGRVGEQAAEPDWAAVCARYRAVAEFRDSALRARFAEGRAALADRAWQAAHDAFTELTGAGWDVGDFSAEAAAGLYDAAVEAETALDWDAARLRYTALPADHADAAARARYAEGRAAEDAADWTAAELSYADTEHADAPVRRGYASGRAAEASEAWADARAAYADLPVRVFDVADRLLYVAGRDGDQRGDWPGLLAGFGRLPDDHQDGDVGARRRFARARIAEGKADWGSVLSFLEGQPDSARGGAVGRLRGTAVGRAAEAAGDWDRAVTGYTPIGDDPDTAARLAYALGRSRADRGDWAGVLAAFESLPADHRDVAQRRGYASARLAEAAAVDPAGWQAAVDAYESLPDGTEDSATRLGYARTRLAEAVGDWTTALAGAEALPGHLDVDAVADHARGRLAEAAGDWAGAAGAYQRCADRADAADRGTYATARASEAVGRWSDAVAAYRQVPPGLGGAGDRLARLLALRAALPWADGLTGAALVADPFAARDATFPYLALREVGITPGSATEVVQNAAYALLERGGMSFQERVAWDRLRSPAKRLRLDAMLYQFRDLAAVRAELATVTVADDPAAEARLLNQLCAALPAEAPLLVLLTRGRDEAIAEWSTRLVADPTDMVLAHNLAVAHLWRARELEESGAWELAGSAWDRALACWAVVLTDDPHWVGWREARAACYRSAVTVEDVAQLRWELGQNLVETLAGYASRHAEQGRPEYARTYERLGHTLERELEGARALAEVGGLPVGDRGADTEEHTLSCGPGYLAQVELERHLAAFVATVERTARDGDDPGELVRRRLRCVFSGLAPAFTFTEHHRFEQAITALPDLTGQSLADLGADCDLASRGETDGDPSDGDHIASCGHCQVFVRHHPAYLLLPHRRARLLQDTVDTAVYARLAMARHALTGGAGGLDRAVAEWEAALAASEHAAMTVRTKQAIQRMVLGRAEALGDEDGARRGDCLGEAIALVERVLPVLGSLGRDTLMAKLAVLRTDRGVWHGYGCYDFGFPLDMASAEVDLAEALRLNPESVRARDNLVRALVFGLDRRPGADTHTAKLTVLAEALSLLHEGLERAPGRARFRETLDDLLEGLDSLLLGDLSSADLGELIRSMATDEPDGPTALAAEAQRKTADGDLAGAARDLIRATRADPASGPLRLTLLTAIRRLLTAPPPESRDEGSDRR